MNLLDEANTIERDGVLVFERSLAWRLVPRLSTTFRCSTGVA